MELKVTLKHINHIADKGNKFIVEELNKRGIKGIVPSHGSILVTLFRHKQMTLKEIAENIKRTQPTVTVLIEKLAENGYIIKSRDPNDTRSTIVRLTKKGEKFMIVFTDISEKLNYIMHKGLTENEIKVLDEVLKKIDGNM